MATLPLPWVDADDDAAARLHDRLEADERIQVPIGVWPVPAARTDGVRPKAFVRISAQRYNEPPTTTGWPRRSSAIATRLRGTGGPGTGPPVRT